MAARVLGCVALIVVLGGCALGAGTAGYAVKAQAADSLTPQAEQRIVDRAKQETITELRAKGLITTDAANAH